MTQDQIMKLVDAYASEACNHGLYGGIHWHKQQIAARAAVVAAIETIENKVTALQDHIAEITSEEHSIPELRQELLDQLEEKRKCYFAVSQYQKANQNLLEQVAALTKDADRWRWWCAAVSNQDMCLLEQVFAPIPHDKPADKKALDAVVDAAIAAQKGEQV